MDINDTIELMQSEDYRDRFRAEYDQITIRLNKLKKMLSQYRDGSLPFKPKCSYNTLKFQAHAMKVYRVCLLQRAAFEEIDLNL